MGANAGMILTGANGVSQFASQQGNANAIVSQSNFDRQLAELNAKDAIARGASDASIREMQGRRTIGTQRAGYAASGIDANVGSPADVQVDEAKFSELDAQTIRNNAAREAFGYRAQAAINGAAAQSAAANERQQSYGTLLTTAANTYGLYRDSHPDNSLNVSSTPKVPSSLKSGIKAGWK